MFRFRDAIVGCLLIATAACRTASIESLVGDQARYASNYRGYVLERPGTQDIIVLIDPLRGRKLRCREDLEPWTQAWGEGLSESVSDGAWDNNAYGYMFPMTAATLAVGLVFAVPYAGTRIPYWAAASQSADALFDQAMTDFRSTRYDESARKLEVALVKGNLSATHWKYIKYYLGLSYEQIGKRDLATLAYRQFLSVSQANDEHAYDVAEARLSTLEGLGTRKCQSQEPFTMPWKPREGTSAR